MTSKEYEALTAKKSPPTKSGKNIPLAFLTGGAICTVGELLRRGYLALGLGDAAGTLTSVTLIFLSVLLTGLKIYDKLAKHSGAGTLVPITGFANAVASPAMEFKTEGMILGLGARMFIIAGPVIVYGIAASVVYGVLYWAAITLF